jgi:hypothetical protein
LAAPSLAKEFLRRDSLFLLKHESFPFYATLFLSVALLYKQLGMKRTWSLKVGEKNLGNAFF